MPIHDWTRVSAGTFHDFHHAWISELRKSLNGGLLPEGYYAQAEQVASQVVPDVLTLQEISDGPDGLPTSPPTNGDGGIAVAEAPPRVSLHEAAIEASILALRRKQLVIRHASGDRVIALLEIVSPGNKDKTVALDAFVSKALSALNTGYHLLVLDLLPPGPLDPRGMHAAIWDNIGRRYEPPAGKPLTLAAYVAGTGGECYVEPTAVGTPLIEMPLFLDPGHYVNVPLEPTYLAAYEGVPRRWKAVIEARA
jgi:hypothetical protein